ncbi:MAG: phage virion morphogenesis protein [Gammaproteobacteria bacterium]|uniref:Putative tail protein n=1 Tax=viral metagenome TaxID=1070528 RepID=A0A6M3KLU2_9ZZZZ|nr:phage virion morphogenesis protein [Gammaproteobacteria bacterium]MBU1505937.1 phage virion morphogenesis protein [Gammaproteobacteria bacterium]MBU2119865.1 phage virion morphogenesis protein [Gammaproteobacteria bacterium]MBU2189757.1 phage virion morphogenesis protein [Gammaproteobacteria bacterium]
MDDLQRLEGWLSPLLQKLTPAERKGLARQVARDLRAANVATMKAQQASDGTPWEPRKPNKLREERGTVHRKAKPAPMFQKLRAAKHLKAQGLTDEAVLEFVGRADRIARVHHFGLEDRVTPGGPTYRYPARSLLGITEEQMQKLKDLVLRHLSA